ncbi:unnamed protein product, partial [Sphacelaria rigidula]
MTPHPKQSLHRAVSPRHSQTTEQMSDSNRRRLGSANRKGTIVFGVLLAVAVTSVVLQVLTSEHRWTPVAEREGNNMGAKYGQDGSSGGGDGDFEDGGGESADHNITAGSGNDHNQLLEPSATETFISKLGVDRRFRGQKTGKPPRTREEKYVARSSAGPFGWGTDWATAVAVPVVVGNDGEAGGVLEEDVIKP